MAETFSQLATRVLQQEPLQIKKQTSLRKSEGLNRSNSRGAAAAQTPAASKEPSIDELIKKTNKEYSEDRIGSIVTNGLIKNMALYDGIELNGPRSEAKVPNKDSIDQRRAQLNTKSKGKVPLKKEQPFTKISKYKFNKNGMSDWEALKATASPKELKGLLDVEERAKPLHQQKAFKERMQQLDKVINDAKAHYNTIQEINQLKENEPELKITKEPDPDLMKGLGSMIGE